MKETYLKDTSSIAAKRFFAKNQKSLSLSRSTPSLPNLVHNESKKQPTEISTVMRRGHSHQNNEAQTNFMEIPKKQSAIKRRHSFSSFLSSTYEKSASVDVENNSYKSTRTSPAIHNFPSNPTLQTRKVLQGKKGHRPRSYSEVPFNLPQVERAPPVAITNKTPAYEYYGFAMYLASFVILGIYLVWAYVPDEILHSLGITYYPNRYWALAIPIWLMTVIWFTFFAFISINVMNTEPLESYHCITDEHANLMRMDKELITDRPSDWMPELHDIPIGLVNKFLYQADIMDPYLGQNTTDKPILTSSPTSDVHLFNDTTEEMSEDDALALTRKWNSYSNNFVGKRHRKI